MLKTNEIIIFVRIISLYLYLYVNVYHDTWYHKIMGNPDNIKNMLFQFHTQMEYLISLQRLLTMCGIMFYIFFLIPKFNSIKKRLQS